MWPWGHLAIGYLSYTAFTHLRYRRSPGERPTVLLVVGTQLPDVVDKPLAWSLQILPHGRSLGHSLFTAIALVIAVRLLLGRRTRSEVASAFGIGYLSHLFVDAFQSASASGVDTVRFLLWPVVPSAGYETTPSFVGHALGVELSPYFLLQFGIAGLTTMVWLHDRKPGLATAKSVPRFAYRKLRTER